jgi:hypothetical protein
MERMTQTEPEAMTHTDIQPKTGDMTMTDTTTVYVVRDASGEYIRDAKDEKKRTPASNEAHEFETREEAQSACTRATDKVLSREAE